MSEGVKMLISALVAIIGAPIVGGILNGIDRRLTARLQGRVGPPLIQPFYDLFKLFGKKGFVAHKLQILWVWGYLIMAIAALVIFAIGQDLLMMAFVLGFGSLCLILAGYSVRSPYSFLGSQREMMQLLSYEPIIVLSVVGIYLKTGSFRVKDVLAYEHPLLASLPLVFVALFIALTIKMRKSPFDIATSHHAHQELVKGVTTEISGPYLAMVELTHWYELVLVLALISIFFAHPLWVGILIALGCFIAEIIIDNATARLTWRWMLRISWAVGVGMVILNLAVIYLFKRGG